MPLLDLATNIAENRDWLYLAPALFLTGWSLIVLVVDLALLRRSTSPRRRVILGSIAMLGTVFSTALGISAITGTLGIDVLQDDVSLFGGLFAGDPATVWLGLVLTILLTLIVGLSMTAEFTERWGVYYALMLIVGSGMILLVAAEELIAIALTLETMTLGLYVLIGLSKGWKRASGRRSRSIAYAVTAPFLMLMGIGLIYGATGTTRLSAIGRTLRFEAVTMSVLWQVAGATALLLIVFSLVLRLATVPFRFGSSSAEGEAPAPVAALFVSGAKLAIMVSLMKILSIALGPWATNPESFGAPGWFGLLVLMAAALMTYGNLAALGQQNLGRLLAYSSVGQIGYVLLGVIAVAAAPSNKEAAGAVLYYLVTYAFAIVGAFALSAWATRDVGRDNVEDLRGFARRSPGIVLGASVLFLSLIGIPPLAGFFGKLAMFRDAVNTDEPALWPLMGLVGLGILTSLISAIYYIRVVRATCIRPSGTPIPSAPPRAVGWLIGVAALICLGLGVYPPAAVDPLTVAAVPMLSPGPDPRQRVGPQGEAADRQAEWLRREQEISNDYYLRYGKWPSVGAGGP